MGRWEGKQLKITKSILQRLSEFKSAKNTAHKIIKTESIFFIFFFIILDYISTATLTILFNCDRKAFILIRFCQIFTLLNYLTSDIFSTFVEKLAHKLTSLLRFCWNLNELHFFSTVFICFISKITPLLILKYTTSQTRPCTEKASRKGFCLTLAEGRVAPSALVYEASVKGGAKTPKCLTERQINQSIHNASIRHGLESKVRISLKKYCDTQQESGTTSAGLLFCSLFCNNSVNFEPIDAIFETRS